MQCILCLIRSEIRYTRKCDLTEYRLDLTIIFRNAHWFPGFLNWALLGPCRAILDRYSTSLNSMPLSFMSLNFHCFFFDMQSFLHFSSALMLEALKKPRSSAGHSVFKEFNGLCLSQTIFSQKNGKHFSRLEWVRYLVHSLIHCNIPSPRPLVQ